MNKLIYRAFALIALVAGSLFAMPAFADSSLPPGYNGNAGFHAVFSLGLTAGGDKLATGDYTDGSSTNVTAGGNFEVGGGVLWQAVSIPLAVSLTANYQESVANASNGSITFKRVPIEAVAYYTGVKKWRFGGGLRFVQSPKLSVDTPTDQGFVDFKNTTGGLVEVGYGFTPHSWVDLRYVSEKYTDVLGGPSVNGSHIGLFWLLQY